MSPNDHSGGGSARPRRGGYSTGLYDDIGQAKIDTPPAANGADGPADRSARANGTATAGGRNTNGTPGFRERIKILEPALQSSGFLYTFAVGYVFINIVLFSLGAVRQYRAYLRQGLALPLCIAGALARGSGGLLNFNSALVLIFASRRVITWLRSTFLNMVVPFDKAMPLFHSVIGHVLVVAGALHTLGHGINYIVLRLKSPGFNGYTSLLGSGIFLLMILIIIRVTVMRWFKKKKFEIFYYAHNVCFVLYFAFIIVHGHNNGKMSSWKFVVAPLVIYTIDRLSRLLSGNVSKFEIAPSSATLLGDTMICLRLPRTFEYLAGQYCDIKVPRVSSVEWHPFTIASSPHEADMQFFIKVSGDWTSKLYKLFGTASEFEDSIVVHVRGPFGAPAQHVKQYEHVVLISGGVGATPFASITKFVHHWILTYTDRGAKAIASVATAFERNQSTQVTGLAASLSSGDLGRSRSARKGMRPGQANDGTSGAARLAKSLSHRIAPSRSAHATPSGRPASHQPRADRQSVERSESGIFIERTHSSYRTGDAEVRTPGSEGPRPRRRSRGTSLDRLEAVHSDRTDYTDPASLGITGTISGGSQYLAGLGDPNAPVPDRRAGRVDSRGSGVGPAGMADFQRSSSQASVGSVGRMRGAGRSGQELVREYNSSRSLFSETDGEDADMSDDGMYAVDSRGIASGRGARGSGGIRRDTSILIHDNEPGAAYSDDEEFDADAVDSLEFENMLIREARAENAQDFIGVSYESAANVRGLRRRGEQRMRPSLHRASMTMMDSAHDSANLSERVLFYLHTVTANWVLLWVMMLRYCIAAIAGIWNGFLLGQKGLTVFNNRGLVVVDLILSLVLAIPVLLAVCLELKLHGIVAFISDSFGNMFDILLLLPLSVGCVVLSLLGLAGIGDTVQHVSKLSLFLFWPIMSMLLFWRIFRTIGSRTMLAQHFKTTVAETKSVDFVWFSKTHEEDEWLVRQMLPLAETDIVRLHRYITREEPKVEPWMLDYEKVPLRTNYGKPNWDEVFAGIAERSKSGTVIGVFFCGPQKMAVAVQQGAMRAMAKSLAKAYRCGYIQAMGDDGAAGGRSANRMRSNSAKVDSSTSHGCAIRFALREEYFG